ncbi:MAG: PepSY domain-containing protein, partial [Chloroflexia bacterium]|nr:PepSY domain-containing protein [Chloroflexia bacterium]
MSKVAILYKKLHKWPGLIISFVLLYYGITGIFMNHRELFSGIDISRKILPENYKYNNWNNAALKCNVIIGNDSVLVYGNIGIWITDSAFSKFISFNKGLPEGSDNRKIFDVHKDNNGELYAATLFGLYAYDKIALEWNRFDLQGPNERFVGIESIGDTLYAINRSYLFKGKASGLKTHFMRVELPTPEGFINKISLFSTLWQIHSGEIFGLPGKLFVDLLGIVTIFLSVTGIIYFFFPNWLKRRSKKDKPVATIARINRWSLRWHNKIGAWTFASLIILFFTGMFLRPPLLIAIARAEVSPLKYSHLDQPNPWYDKLRDILYDNERDILLISTSDGMYFTEVNHLQPVRFINQPPVSVMGINTLQSCEKGAFLIGSFSGLFLWHPDYPEVYNYATGKLYQEQTSGR